MARHAPASVRRAQILEAARRCFALKGFHGTRMDDVVRACGLSKGALYHHFAGKDALLLGLFEAYEAGIWQQWAELDRLPPLDALYQQAAGTLDALADVPDLADTWLAFVQHPECRSRFADVYRKSRHLVARTVNRGIRSGEIQGSHPPAIAALMTASVEGLILQALVDPRFDPRAAWRRAWPALRDGLAV